MQVVQRGDEAVQRRQKQVQRFGDKELGRDCGRKEGLVSTCISSTSGQNTEIQPTIVRSPTCVRVLVVSRGTEESTTARTCPQNASASSPLCIRHEVEQWSHIGTLYQRTRVTDEQLSSAVTGATNAEVCGRRNQRFRHPPIAPRNERHKSMSVTDDDRTRPITTRPILRSQLKVSLELW